MVTFIPTGFSKELNGRVEERDGRDVKLAAGKEGKVVRELMIAGEDIARDRG